VLERVKKLEAGGVIGGYHAVLDARRLGLDVTAFIGVITSVPELRSGVARSFLMLGPATANHRGAGADL
jgi:DNA-binding Lrp family transcriptional regulator